MPNNPTDPRAELDEIVMAIRLADTDSSLTNTGKDEVIASLIDQYASRVCEDIHTQLLDALYGMYSQYCSGGHDFMGAGEDASELLENAGYIKVNGAGEIIQDNGDSHEQRLKQLNEGSE